MTTQIPERATIFDTNDAFGGSVQHFAHFMKDYFIEIALWCDDHPGEPIVVRDCGPCTPWFDLLIPRNHVTVVSAAELFTLTQSYRERVYAVRGLAFLNRPRDLKALSRFRLALSNQRVEATRERVMAIRSVDPAFYSSPESERPLSGPSRRRLGNERTIATMLRQIWSFRIVEFFDLSPRESIDLMSVCSVFVAQRGAAMMNLLFMPAGGIVIEICPKDMNFPEEHRDLYGRACAVLGLTHVRIEQRTKYARVSPLRIVLALLCASVLRSRCVAKRSTLS